MATKQESQLANEALFEKLATPGLEKQAIDAVNDFTRVRMREDSFQRRIIPPLQISNDELDRRVEDDKPVKVVDKEPGSPAAITLPFGTNPKGAYIRGPRYEVKFARIVTPRFIKDVDELRTWIMDIRQVLSDNALKDLLAEEDSKFVDAFNTAIGGSAGTTVSHSGIVQWDTISGGITRDTVVEAHKIMPKTPGHLEVDTCLVNNVTIKEMMKWGRDEMGGDFSQEVIKNGWSDKEFLDARWIVTIKRDLVPDDSMFMFADPKFIGKSYVLEDATMFIDRQAFMLEFFAYESIGGALANTHGLARADFV